MKTSTINIIAILIFVFVFCSCYTDFEPDLDTSPVLCMNSVLEVDSTVKVSLSHTYRWSDGQYDSNLYETLDVTVRDAEVSLYVNGELKDVMKFSVKEKGSDSVKREEGYYSSFRPSEGDQIRLVAKSKEYGEAYATVTMPSKVCIEDIDVVTLECRKLISTYVTTFIITQDYSIWFTDPGETDNYYRILVNPVNPDPVNSGEWVENSFTGEKYERVYNASLRFWNIVNDNEPLFNEQSDVLDGIFGSSSVYCSVFSDRRIKGKRYPLSLRLDKGELSIYNPEKIESLYDVRLRFDLYSISQSYYSWFVYDWYRQESFQGMLGDVGLAEVVMPDSNVSTNAGVVAACSRHSFYISFKDFLKENVDSDNY